VLNQLDMANEQVGSTTLFFMVGMLWWNIHIGKLTRVQMF